MSTTEQAPRQATPIETTEPRYRGEPRRPQEKPEYRPRREHAKSPNLRSLKRKVIGGVGLFVTGALVATGITNCNTIESAVIPHAEVVEVTPQTFDARALVVSCIADTVKKGPSLEARIASYAVTNPFFAPFVANSDSESATFSKYKGDKGKN